MAKTPKPGTAKAAEALTEVAVEAVVAHLTAQNMEAPSEDSGPPSDDTRVKLAQLLAHLKIVKIVFVDDKAEQQTDAGAVIKVLAAKEAAREPLGVYFPGVTLTLENDALFEQLAARLGMLDAQELAALRGVLSAQSDEAAEHEALGRLQDLLPEATTAHLLTPHAWHERRAALIDECKEDRRILFLFDQELEVDDAGHGRKGKGGVRDPVVLRNADPYSCERRRGRLLAAPG
jgi:hypothetical protein